MHEESKDTHLHPAESSASFGALDDVLVDRVRLASQEAHEDIEDVLGIVALVVKDDLVGFGFLLSSAYSRRRRLIGLP